MNDRPAEILMTGFGLWGAETRNSSWDMLADRTVAAGDGWLVRTLRLPVSWRASAAVLHEAISSQTKAVVCFGMAPGDRVLVERIAVNLVDGAKADCEGRFPGCEHVRAGGPPAYWTRLPWRELLSVLEAEGVACRESHHAGTFLCNFVFYSLMDLIETDRPDLLGGFIHVPRIAEGRPVELDVLRRAADVVAKTLATP